MVSAISHSQLTSLSSFFLFPNKKILNQKLHIHMKRIPQSLTPNTISMNSPKKGKELTGWGYKFRYKRIYGCLIITREGQTHFFPISIPPRSQFCKPFLICLNLLLCLATCVDHSVVLLSLASNVKIQRSALDNWAEFWTFVFVSMILELCYISLYLNFRCYTV